MKKNKLLILVPILLLSIVSILVIKEPTGLVNPSPIVSSTPTKGTTTAIIDFGNGKQINEKYNFEQGLNAFSLLEKVAKEKNLKIGTKKYDFGIFIQSVDGLESGSELAWIFFVNGKSADKAADQFPLNPGDVVEWRYIKPIY